ncbi:CoxG family protein [Aquibacillus albus]|uniref:Carbon monoxide dehydrogenase subunit G n=1 Tax=Aquibacillus albus TaxID=1168171 RepID=A0ABS2MYW6_9BACI|nr:SRPBCC family protein [Aquibacillus albus]MBM7571034.1 carbon monoxide dehydrogenase subunit G [Aquibacillus albus]
MPSGTHSVELNVPIETIWKFVSDINKWAPLVPGYVKHQIRNPKQSIWELTGEVGNVQKKVNLQIDIIKWQEPTKVTFDIKGLNEKFDGVGYFEAEALSKTNTKITGYINITTRGMLGTIVNPVLTSLVQRKTLELTDAMADKLVKVKSATK